MLASAGLNVSAVYGFVEFVQSIEDQDCDLLIICHSLSAEEQNRAVQLIRQRVRLEPILVLTKGQRDTAVEHCEMMSASDGPANLIAKSRMILQASSSTPQD